MQINHNIAVIARIVYPHATGGAEIHTYYVAKELAKHNNVILISGSNDKRSVKFQECFVHLNICIPSIPFFSSMLFTMYAIVLLLFKANRIDVLHAQVVLSPVVVGMLAKMFLNVPLVITCHGSEVRLQKNLLIKSIQQIAFRIADHITAVSQEIKRTLVAHYHVTSFKIDVIPNGYDITQFNSNSNDPERNTFNIVSVGRLSYPKDPLTVLHAFKQIHKVIPNVHLYFVGDGQLLPLLKQFCTRHKLFQQVHFLGNLPHQRALQATAESTVFIVSSSEEGLPTSLIEAMALEKPVIATAVGGIPEIVEDGVNGILIPPKSPEHLAKALERLLTDSRLRRKMGKAAAESVKDYSWSNIAERYEKLYCELIQKQKAC
jgi:glycosyltransferase involved in cell wall biosynthesis